MSWKASDAAELDKQLERGANLYMKAFDHDPRPDNFIWLYRAGASARKANNADLAVSIYNRILEVRKDDARALFERGLVFREIKRDNARYFADQAASAKLGYVYAQNNIGYFYMSGDDGFPVDLQEAKAWLTMAANQGFQHSKEKLAYVESLLAQQRKTK